MCQAAPDISRTFWFPQRESDYTCIPVAPLPPFHIPLKRTESRQERLYRWRTAGFPYGELKSSFPFSKKIPLNHHIGFALQKSGTVHDHENTSGHTCHQCDDPECNTSSAHARYDFIKLFTHQHFLLLSLCRQLPQHTFRIFNAA